MDEDYKIVQQVQQGDTEAFSLLINKYKKPILNLVYRYTGNAGEAEDAAQEIFLRAFKGLRKFKAEAKFFTWLYRIAINYSLRKRQRDNKFIFQSLEQKTEQGKTKEINEKMETGSVGGNPSGDLESKELSKIVRQAVESLPEDQRTVVILYRYQGMKYEEIARVLDISLSAVKSRLHRARKALKDKLEKYVMQ